MFARVAASAVVLVAMVLMSSPSGFGQQKGKGKGFDPGKIFEDNAKDGFIVIATYPRNKEEMEKWAKEHNITNGKLNRDQYLQYFNERTKGGGGGGNFKGGSGNNFKGGGNNFKGGGPQGGNNFFRPAAPAPENKAPEKPRDELAKLAEEEFKKRDTNNDGKLNYDEMDQVLRQQLVHWDKNGDQHIDLPEFTAYFIDRYQEKEREKSQSPSAAQVYEDDLDKRPVVFRNGKLPKELPDWYFSFDTNEDGLVSLAEWVKKGKTTEEFAAMDRDGDGLLTADEVLRFYFGGSLPSSGGSMLVQGGGPGRQGGGRGKGGGNQGGLGQLFFGGFRGQPPGDGSQVGQGQGQGQGRGKGKGGGGFQFKMGGN